MTALAGKRILVVEDEAIIAAMLEDLLIELGATVLGPAYSLASGQDLATSAEIDGAVLDANLNGAFVGPVAEILRARDVPFIFASGYGRHATTERFGVPVLEKPYTAEEIAEALCQVLGAVRPALGEPT